MKAKIFSAILTLVSLMPYALWASPLSPVNRSFVQNNKQKCPPDKCPGDSVAIYAASTHGKDSAVDAAVAAAFSDPEHPELPSQPWLDACSPNAPDQSQSPDIKGDTCVVSNAGGITIVRVCFEFPCLEEE